MLLKLRSHYRNIVELHNKEADWSRRHIWNGSSKNKHTQRDFPAKQFESKLELDRVETAYFAYFLTRRWWRDRSNMHVLHVNVIWN